MTPQSANLNLVNALQAQPAGRKQAPADTPFSQVLSSEIAQKKPVNESRNDVKRETKKDVQSGSDAKATANDATAAQDTAPADASAPDSKHSTVADDSKASADASKPDTAQSTTQPVADPTTMLPSGMLALAAAPNQLTQPLSPPSVDSKADSTDVLKGRAPALLDSLNTPPAATAKPDQLTAVAVNAKTTAAQQPAKADFQAAMTATTAHATAAAAALPGQIAAALSPDSLQADDTGPDGIGSPIMAAAAQHALLNTVSAPASAAGSTLAPSVGSAAWSQALGEKIVWMTAGAQQTASLTLNPPNLGPLHIVLNVTNDQATASFFSAQPDVRHALEAAMPKLREMMNESGIQLGQATVSAEQQPQQQHNEAANRGTRQISQPYPGTNNAIETGAQTLPTMSRQSGRGLVDTFA
jgi:flagellar hook-length control protein FliK